MQNTEKIPVICVVGPTASGKTSFAIKLAKRLDGEIVSLDSMQIYKYLNIGTAKPTEKEQSEAKHHLIGYIDPRTPYSASDYAKDAAEVILNIYEHSKTPILCGGTGLYLDSLLNGFNMSEASFDNDVREKYYAIAKEKSNEYLHTLLRKVDEKSADEIHPNNVKRVVRALEIYELTGKPRSEQLTKADNSPYKSVIFLMDRERDELYSRIDRRVDIMAEQGLVDEVRSLLEKEILPRDISTQASQAIGYKEIISYLNGDISLDEAINQIKLNSRHYAKRQLTWFRRNKDIISLNPDNPDSVNTAISKFNEI